jgi:hypothetical protein
MIPKVWDSYDIKWERFYHSDKEHDLKVLSIDDSLDLKFPDEQEEFEDGDMYDSDTFFDCN